MNMSLTNLFLPNCSLLAASALLLLVSVEPSLATFESTTAPAADSSVARPAVGSQRGEADFALQLDKRSDLLQQGDDYRRFGVEAETGDIEITDIPGAVQSPNRSGGRVVLQPKGVWNGVRMETFATTNNSGTGYDSSVVGATGEISSVGKALTLKTLYLSGREALDPWPLLSNRRKGEVLGLFATVDPFGGKLAAEAEVGFSSFDVSTADDVSAVSDSACHVKFFGRSGGSRYSALYERIGPQYRVVGARVPKRDSEGVSLALATESPLHALDLKVSRYNDNVGNSVLYPRLYKYEGIFDYTFKGVKSLPLGLRYRKTITDSDREPAGWSEQKKDEDAFSGRLRYLSGRWDLGMEATYSQRSDGVRGELDSTATGLSLSPKFSAWGLNVAPEFAMKRSKDFVNSVDGDEYAVNLGINGKALEKKLDYEVRGGYKKEWTNLPDDGRDTLTARVKAAYPLIFLGNRRRPVIGIKGEYTGVVNQATSDRRSNAVSLLFSIEGASDSF